MTVPVALIAPQRGSGPRWPTPRARQRYHDIPTVHAIEILVLYLTATPHAPQRELAARRRMAGY